VLVDTHNHKILVHYINDGREIFRAAFAKIAFGYLVGGSLLILMLHHVVTTLDCQLECKHKLLGHS
jgi:hypothetical protein